MLPEALARTKIDALLTEAGWIVQKYKEVNLSAGPAIAVCEIPISKIGRPDYVLLLNRKSVGIIEAKKEGTTLSGVAEQSAHYGDNLPDFLKNPGQIRFYYESTGVETYFRDQADPDPRSRRVFAFHQPGTLEDWLEESTTLRDRLQDMPVEHPLVTTGMRDCQIEAITNLEKSFAADKPRALIQMTMGAGKTYTACALAYRLIKYAGAKRILFLVDRSNLGKQTATEFDQYATPDGNRKFTELYNVQHLTSNKLDDVSKVTISTIQRVYSMLRGEELPEEADELSAFEFARADDRPKDVKYNPVIPIEAFDFIIVDECHRSIYNLWRQVIEYFDASLVGLTATPSKQTIGFFNQNLVTEYGHERAVADGVNVGYDVYRIKTKITEQGATVEKGFYVDKRNKQSRVVRWQQLDEDFTYAQNELDRSVVVKSQIRTVLQTFKDVVTTVLFPGREMVPKTLIFAKDDSHAEDIVHMCREVFGKGNDFCKKITYKAYNPDTKKYEKAETLVQEFRTAPALRVAVTVDMIATGTDIKPLECLLFLRDVRSLNYFEQMKGRGTRVLTPTDLQSVSGQDAKSKDRFIIVDAVGVCESDKSDSRPLDRDPGKPTKAILQGVALGKRDENTITTLAGRLARIDRRITEKQRAELAEMSGGKTLAQISADLLDSVDPDKIAVHATGLEGAGPSDVMPEQYATSQKSLIDLACVPLDNPVFRDRIISALEEAEQTIDVTSLDEVTEQGFSASAKEKAEGLVTSFKQYIEENKTQIDALQILYSRPYSQRLNEKTLKELERKLREQNRTWTEENLWRAFSEAAPGQVKGRSAVDRFADLIPMVRFALEQQPILEPFADTVHQRFDKWLARKAADGTKFTDDQRTWLEMIRDHIATSVTIEPDDLAFSPFSQRGGLGRASQLFGNQLPQLLQELNEALAA